MAKGGRIKFVMCSLSLFFLFFYHYLVLFRFFLSVSIFCSTDIISLFMSVNCQLHRGVVLAYKSWGKSDTITTIIIPSKIESASQQVSR